MVILFNRNDVDNTDDEGNDDGVNQGHNGGDDDGNDDDQDENNEDENLEDEDILEESDVVAEQLEKEKSPSLSWFSLDGYVNAVMDLWKTQHTLGRMPGQPVPVRAPCVKEFLKNAKKEVMIHENKSYVDRGLGTLADEATACEQGQLALHYWNQKNEEGLRMRADYLLSFALTSRGDNIRNLKLSEIGHRFFPSEGTSVIMQNVEEEEALRLLETVMRAKNLSIRKFCELLHGEIVKWDGVAPLHPFLTSLVGPSQ
jgi:hypothetical protein